MTIPAREVLNRAERERAASDETNGFLSEAAGLLPLDPPLTSLPESHGEWDAIASQLPDLFRTLTARAVLDEMPVLAADARALPDASVWRACALMGMFAHTYVRVLPQPPDALPASIERPWAELCGRLHRTQTALTYDDLISYNWRPRDPRHPERRDLEDLELLTPTVGTREERIFYLAQVEILARGAPIIGAMVRAQEAVVHGDQTALQAELVTVMDTVERAGKGAFLKIDANPYSPTFVDPVVWAKTVAPFAVAIRESSHAISGAAAPLFQAIDVFIGRRRFDSRVGREGRRLRPAFSPHFRAFVDGLEAVSVASFVSERGSADTKGLWHSLLETYVGRDGFLAVHRRKAYAFLELAFKVGRSVTTGGFTGLFEDQTWDIAHAELEASRLERTDGLAAWCPVAHPAQDARGDLSAPGLVHVTLDVADAGLRHRPGERLALVPQNDPALVDRTLEALRASGDELVRLDGRWRAAFPERGPRDACSLRELLTFGRIRPSARETAETLARYAGSEQLARIVAAREDAGWEFRDILDFLSARGSDPRALWKADPWEDHSICKLVPPEEPRLYSISSVQDPERPTADQVELVLSEVLYATSGATGGADVERRGTASGFLRRIADGTHPEVSFPVRVVPAPRFRPPDDESVPLVMFAGGAGISPFRSFIAARARVAEPGPATLFMCTRSDRHIALYAADLEPHTRAGWLRFEPTLTHGAAARTGRSGIRATIASHAAELYQMLRDDGPAPRAVFFVCGAAGFSVAVLEALEDAIEVSCSAPDPRAHARLLMRRLIASGRLQQDVFTSDRGETKPLPAIDASAVALHNDPEHGYWCVIDGGVYDVTEFAHRHPGGMAIVHENAGRDATEAFRTIEHDQDPEIMAMLGMYKIGDVARVDFGGGWTIAVGRSGLSAHLLSDVFASWVRLLYRVVEVQNAVRHDFGILDAVTVAGDRADTMTLLKAQLLLEAHQRFLSIYLPSLLGPGLDDVWAMTTGLCAPQEDARALAERIAPVHRSDGSASHAESLEELWAHVRALGSADENARARAFSHLTALRGELEDIDLRCLDGLKTLVSGGVRAFETDAGVVAARSPGTLMGALASIPDVLTDLHEGLAFTMVERALSILKG